ncbi:MAG TPA: 3-hydroxyacyl-ACP dehydratase FabZ [Clostridia bacterium]|nr:3-hydroxyacyl-ACP dehydratase FabZ [Clostridia bacterium]
MINITSILSHRYPFVFVDRITDREVGKWVKGRKMVSHNEWFFQGHFPDEPIMPGVLILEAIAQLSPFVDCGQDERRIGLLASVDSIKWIAPVFPGDELSLYFEVTSCKGPFIKGNGCASVDGREVAAAKGMTIFRK